MSVAHWFGGNCYAKEMVLSAGQSVMQHKHKHEHLSVLASGTVRVMREGEAPAVVEGPRVMRIEAHRHHGIEALTDVVWYCIHAIPPELSTDEVLAAEIDSALIEG